MKNKILMSLALGLSTVASIGLADPAMAASKQTVIDTSLSAYKAPVQRVLNKGEKLTSLSANCLVYKHTMFDCTFTAKTVLKGQGHKYSWPMVGYVKRGAHATHIDRYLNGVVSLGSSHIVWNIAG